MRDRLANNYEWSKRALKVLFPKAQSYLNILPPNEYPRYFSKAKGAYVWDIDGNKYIDLFLGSGAIIIGHGNEELMNVIKTQLDHGASVSMHHPAEVEVAEWFSNTLPFANRVAYFKTGSEATHASLRMIYNITKKPYILSLGYHGWISPFEDIFKCDINVVKMEWEKNSIEETFERLGKKIGAVIVSPDPRIVSKEFYQWLENLTKDYDAYFIADEIKSGFRMAFPSFFYSIGLSPDICLFGKAVSNGFPLSIMVSKEELVEKYSFEYFSTFAGEPISLIAARETIYILENGEYHNYEAYSNYIFGKLKDLLKNSKIKLIGMPNFFRLIFPSSECALLFAKKLARKGVLLHPYDDFLISSAHNKDILNDILIGISSTISELEVEG
jgi:glutamate-1-semialdehyde 2,1-aminomutase/spore coat polysaccharide biosynthesis protein SpsF